ncbi:MAG: Histone acetyltransferase [Pseudomonas sp.]|nr:Histone acetyltransferase [Pseudomonas sp.]
MVQLITMNHDQFQRFLAHSAAGYAHELEQTYQQADALQATMQGLQELLPNGLETPGHHVFNLHAADDEIVGVLWFGVSREHDIETLFIYDLEIAPHARRRGHGKAALQQVEHWATARAIQNIELNVFFDNHPARALYEGFGLKPREMTLTKPLR